jgi:hypothetical protein
MGSENLTEVAGRRRAAAKQIWRIAADGYNQVTRGWVAEAIWSDINDNQSAF